MFSTTKLSVIALLSFVGLFGTGCAAQASDGTASTDSDLAVTPGEAVAALDTGTFDLYNTPNASTPIACSIHTQLTLSNNGKSTHASLRDVAQGPCAIYVMPNNREYDLKVASNSCGSVTFAGQMTVGASTHHVAITDNRKRACEDFVASSPIVVDEYDVAGDVTTRYSVTH